MTYAVGGLIQAADYNGFIGTMNGAWATGASSAGYGQPDFVPVVSGASPPALIRARPATVLAGTPPTWSATPEWRALVDSVNKMSLHQIGGAAPIAAGNYAASASLPTSTTAATGLIAYGGNFVATLNTVTGTQRLNAALQGASTTTSATNTVAWSDYCQFVWTITFGSHNQARYFFNAGGQIGWQASHPAGVTFTINQLINDLCSDAGTLWLSSTNGAPATVSLAGVSYNGITKVGGANPGGVSITPNNGFYALGGVATNVFVQLSDFVYHGYGATKYQISLAYNGAGVITATVLLDEIPNGATVVAGTVSTCVIRPPSTSQLADSWGTPTVSTAITRA